MRAEHGRSPSLRQPRFKNKYPSRSSPRVTERLRSLPGLVEEDVPRLRVLGDVRGKSIKLLDSLGVDFLPDTQHRTLHYRKQQHMRESSPRGERKRATHLHNVVIEQQPEAMTLHYGDVMSSVWTAEDTQTNTNLFHCATQLASTVGVRRRRLCPGVS